MDEEIRPIIAQALADSGQPLPSPCKENTSDSAGERHEFTIVPHDGFVMVYTDTDKTVFTHMITNEKFQVHGRGWTLEFDDDGFAVAVPPDSFVDSDPIALEDAMKFQLCRVGDGSYVIVGNGPGHQGQHIHMTSHMQRW